MLVADGGEETVLAAVRLGCTTIVLGPGGAGMAQALGARILDATGRPVPPGGATLARGPG